MSTLPLGSFARGLYSAHETAISLIVVLQQYDAESAADYLLEVRETKSSQRAIWERVLKRVVKKLNTMCPPFSYVGHHVTDVGNWGVWIDLGALHRAEERGILIQGDSSSKGRSTYILDVSGRGVRLFKRKGGEILWEDV